jgi:hypothetical protein
VASGSLIRQWQGGVEHCAHARGLGVIPEHAGWVGSCTASTCEALTSIVNMGSRVLISNFAGRDYSGPGGEGAAGWLRVRKAASCLERPRSVCSILLRLRDTRARRDLCLQPIAPCGQEDSRFRQSCDARRRFTPQLSGAETDQGFLRTVANTWAEIRNHDAKFLSWEGLCR